MTKELTTNNLSSLLLVRVQSLICGGLHQMNCIGNQSHTVIFSTLLLGIYLVGFRVEIIKNITSLNIFTTFKGFYNPIIILDNHCWQIFIRNYLMLDIDNVADLWCVVQWVYNTRYSLHELQLQVKCIFVATLWHYMLAVVLLYALRYNRILVSYV